MAKLQFLSEVQERINDGERIPMDKIEILYESKLKEDDIHNATFYRKSFKIKLEGLTNAQFTRPPAVNL